MAQTKKKRRRKHRGTQGGSINTTRRQARPQSRAEARARARSKRSGKPQARADRPADLARRDHPRPDRRRRLRLFLALIMGRPFGGALALGAFMLAFYIPAGYFIDRAMWRRRERARLRGKA